MKARRPKQPFGIRLQLLARLTLNAGKHPANQPARLAQLDDGDDCAILVQGDDLLKSFSWGITALRQLFASDDGAISSPPAPYHLSAPGARSSGRGAPRTDHGSSVLDREQRRQRVYLHR